MREILFRGKRFDNGEWTEGYLIHDEHLNTHIPYIGYLFDDDIDVAEIILGTVGQFTGLTDKNGKKIFEGDIFHLDDEIVAVVIFQNGCFRLEEYGIRGAFTESGFDECGGGWDVIDCSPVDWYTVNDMEIIGNIHDNPELMEK